MGRPFPSAEGTRPTARRPLRRSAQRLSALCPLGAGAHPPDGDRAATTPDDVAHLHTCTAARWAMGSTRDHFTACFGCRAELRRYSAPPFIKRVLLCPISSTTFSASETPSSM